MKIDKYSAILGNTVGFHDMDGLTEHRPIATLPFGGKYRLIDFPLSNLANAGIRSVFGIFQNENISSVFDHIRSGREWGLSTLLSHYYLGIYNTPVESSTVDEEYYRQILTYLKRSGSDQTVALNSDVLVNIDLNQVFHLHNTTEQKVTVVYKKLPKELISDVNSILEIDESDKVLSHELFQGGDKEAYNMFKTLHDGTVKQVWDGTTKVELGNNTTSYAAAIGQLFEGIMTPGTFVDTYQNTFQTNVNDRTKDIKYTGSIK